MSPETLFHQLLGLGTEWEVVECRFESETGIVFLKIRETPQLWDSLRCPADGGRVFCYDHCEELTWRHLNVFEHRCEITCRLPRAKCRLCDQVFRVRPPWEGLSSHFTKEFEAFALLLMREMPVNKVAQIVGETDTRLWRMLFRHVERAYAKADFKDVAVVGVDEMNVRKGHHYLSVFADLIDKRVLFATEGKDAQTWARFARELIKHNGDPQALKQVSMDMSGAYQSGAANTCPQAQLVFDKFHVIKNANEALDQVRRAELRLGDKSVQVDLRGSQWLWRKNPENLNSQEQQRMAGIQNKNLATAKAYQMRLVLQDIYRSEDVATAKKRFRVWCRWVRWVGRFYKDALFGSMLKLAGTVQNHLEGILGHWKSSLTNAFMEGLNSVFSATKRKARGYRSTHYLIAMLYFTAGKLKIPHLAFH
jgi:transposase